MPATPSASSRVRAVELGALGAVLTLAVALRAVGASYGLPYPLLNPDEVSIVPRAWAMVHGAGLDPGWFDYPTLLFYLLAPWQALADEPSYGIARVLAVTVGVAGVGAAWWLGRGSYGARAGLVGAAAVALATTHVAYSRMAVTDVLLTTLVTLALALAVAGRLEWAGAAVGLAAAAKYPGLLAAVPVLVAGLHRWRALARAGLLAATAFVVASPFVVLRAGAAWGDVSRVQRLARDGWLGFEDDPAAPLAFAGSLWRALGPFLLAAALGLVVAARQRARPDLVLLSFAAAYGAYLLPLGAHFDRYVLPLVPVAAVLAARTRALAAVAVVTLLVPLAWSIADAREHTRTDTREVTAAWIDTHVGLHELIAVDPSAVALRDRDVLQLELPGPGREPDADRSIERLRALGVDYVVVSGVVTDRVRAAPEHYPAEVAFYDALDRETRTSFSVDPASAGLTGPWVRVHRL